MTRKVPKLILNRETVRLLGNPEQAVVWGGNTGPGCKPPPPLHNTSPLPLEAVPVFISTTVCSGSCGPSMSCPFPFPTA